MATQSANTLKGWFVTLAKPLQNQFWDWIDSFRHKSDKIIYDDLHADLQTLINNIPAGGSYRPEEKAITGNTTITVLAKYKLVGIAVKNPSAFDLVFYLNYPSLMVPVGDAWVRIDVPAASTVDVQINQTFWANTDISMNEQTGVDFSATPLILLIDRK